MNEILGGYPTNDDGNIVGREPVTEQEKENTKNERKQKPKTDSESNE